MNISWIPNTNLTGSSAIEYKDVATEKWRATNYVKMNYSEEIIYHIEHLQPGTSYKFRLILKYLEYDEIFIWPDDGRFIFSTLGKQIKIPIQHNKVVNILKNNFFETLKYCKSIANSAESLL